MSQLSSDHVDEGHRSLQCVHRVVHRSPYACTRQVCNHSFCLDLGVGSFYSNTIHHLVNAMYLVLSEFICAVGHWTQQYTRVCTGYNMRQCLSIVDTNEVPFCFGIMIVWIHYSIDIICSNDNEPMTMTNTYSM